MERKKTILFLISFFVIFGGIFALDYFRIVDIPLLEISPATIHRTKGGRYVVDKGKSLFAIQVSETCSSDSDCTGYCMNGNYYYGDGQCMEAGGGEMLCYYDSVNHDDPDCEQQYECSDICTEGDRRCYGNVWVEECQDWDSDSCTDGWQEVQDCSGQCQNAQCVGCDVKRYCDGGDVWKQYSDCSTSEIETCGTNEECTNGECVTAATPQGTTTMQYLGSISAKITRFLGFQP